VEELLARDQSRAVQRIMAENWESVVAFARQEMAAYFAGRAMRTHYRRTCQEIEKLADNVEFRDILTTGLGMFLLRDHDPRMFVSDRAFRFQLVRRLRGLTDVNAGEWFNNDTGKVQRAYRELPPRAAEEMAGVFVPFFARAAAHTIRVDREDREKKQAKVEALDRAFGKISASNAQEEEEKA
jgi:hypothetical protein